MMCFLQQDEDRIWKMQFIALTHLAFIGLGPPAESAPEQRGDHDLLFALIDLVELQYRTAPRLKQLLEIEGLEVIEDH